MVLLLSNIFVCVCALFSLVFGIICFWKPRKGLYAKMAVLGIGCIVFGRLFQIVRLLTGGEILGAFQLGLFGTVGSLMFFFSSNFGIMDSLADDGAARYKKYRLIALAAPLAALAIYVIFTLCTSASLLWKIIAAVLTVFIMQTAYFNLKHLIFPDVDYGVIDSLKFYNGLVLAYSLLCSAELAAMSAGAKTAYAIISALMGICMLLIAPMLSRGVKQWTT